MSREFAWGCVVGMIVASWIFFLVQTATSNAYQLGRRSVGEEAVAAGAATKVEEDGRTHYYYGGAKAVAK